MARRRLVASADPVNVTRPLSLDRSLEERTRARMNLNQGETQLSLPLLEQDGLPFPPSLTMVTNEFGTTIHSTYVLVVTGSACIECTVPVQLMSVE